VSCYRARLHRRVFRRLAYAIAIALVTSAIAAGGLGLDAFAGFQRRATDALFPSAKSNPDVVVVGIDSETANKLGGYPPSRSVDAEIGQLLADAGASVVVWDLIFTQPREGDVALAEALAAPPATVLAEAIRAVPRGKNLFEVAQIEGSNTPELSAAPNTTIGHTLVTPDGADGVVRTVPLVVVEPDGTPVPALSFEALRAFYGETGPITIRPDGVQVGGRFVPTEGRHQLRLNWASDLEHVDSSGVISAADLLDRNVSPNRFRDKIVFIGATTPIAGDTKLVPVDKTNTFPGVMIHANAVNTILTSSYLEPAGDTETVLWCAIVAFLAALALLFIPELSKLPVGLSVLLTFVLALLVTTLIGAGYLIIGFLEFDQGHVLDFVFPPFIALPFAFLAAFGVRLFTESRKRWRVSALFAQYVPEAVARELEESGALDEHIEGERLDVGLFFCDLRGFTSLSSKLEPTQVRAMLNRFYDLLTEIIHTHGGTVLKFVGDEVFAVFGAPLPLENNAQATFDCAIEIQQRAHELDRDLADLEIPPVQFGIGMNAGFVVAAHVGGGRRRQYDIVGDTVNLGSRLCGQAGKGEIVLPEAMTERLTNIPELESMGAVQLKGLDEPVPLLRVPSDRPAEDPTVPVVAGSPPVT